jgi:5-formyltetrahydrofolate cyclo-ligase
MAPDGILLIESGARQTMEPSPIQRAKATLRETVLASIQALDPDQMVRESAQARDRLCHLAVWRDARSVLAYAPMVREVDLWPVLETAQQDGKRIALPHYEKSNRRYCAKWVQDIVRDLKIGWSGIREPADFCEIAELNKLDLVLVPGVAFDRYGRRLGRGKGFYDRLLSSAGGVKCGVGWDVQICAQVPAEPHDVKLDCILTPTQWLVAGHESV